jgi:hypothetical protein
MKKMIGFLMAGLVAGQALAQKDYSSDVKSEEAIVAALYEVISGEANTPRDWARFRNLFKPEAPLIPTRKTDKGELTVGMLSPEEYVTLFTTKVTTGFFEKERSHKSERYGTVAHVFSTYETQAAKEGPVTNRGINSIQLFNDGNRYYIVTVFWCAESLGFPLPDRYLN